MWSCLLCTYPAHESKVIDRSIVAINTEAAVQIVVVDEIGSPAEAAAVRGIAQRGVAMVGTAHGTDLSSLLANPDLNSLIGGVHQVTLGDAEARSGPGHIGNFAKIHR